MADILCKGRVKRTKTKAEQEREGTTNKEVAEEVDVKQSVSAMQELYSDSVFRSGTDAIAVCQVDGYSVLGGANTDIFGGGRSNVYQSYQSSSANNQGEVDGEVDETVGYAGTDKVEQDIVRQSGIEELYGDVDFDPDVHGNDDVDQMPNELLSDDEGERALNQMSLGSESDEDDEFDEEEEANAFKGRKGFKAMMRKARGDKVGVEEIVSSKAGKSTAYRRDYDDVKDEGEANGQDASRKKRRIEVASRDAWGNRVLSKDAVIEEMWLANGKIELLVLMRTFGISKKMRKSDPEKVKAFMTIVSEVAIKRDSDSKLMLKQQYYQNRASS